MNLTRLAGYLGFALLAVYVVFNAHASTCCICCRRWAIFADDRCRRHRLRRHS